MPFLTPDTPPSDKVVRWLRIPNDVYWIGLVGGAIQAICETFQFEEYGTYSAEDTTQVFRTMMLDWMTPEMTERIGEVKAIMTATIPANYLELNGQQVSGYDYPALYDAVDTLFHVAPHDILLPDLRGRSVIGVGHGAGLETVFHMGENWGEETHHIAVTELPAHHHAQNIITGTNAHNNTGIAGTNRSYANFNANSTVVLNTDDTGGAQPMTMYHPVTALRMCVVAL